VFTDHRTGVTVTRPLPALRFVETAALLVCLGLLPAGSTLGSDRVPTRCVARWQGPGEGCSLNDAVSAEALGASERAASKQALRNLAAAAEAARIHKAASLPPGARSLFLDSSEQCGEVTDRAIVTCFPEPHLRSARYCWLELELDLCRASQGFFLESKAWVHGEQTRREICGEPPDDAFGDEPVSERDAACLNNCWQQGKLSCGAAKR